MPYGLLNVNKPAGLTSRQVVNRVQRLVRPAKVGHAGTLDPLATGVLILGIGAATRLIQYLHRMPKAYVGAFLLGRSSTTDDIEGDVVELPNPPVPLHDDVARAVRAFVGTISQRPPVYSAIKVQGRRAYDLARRGETPALAARPVTVHELEIVDYEYPQLTLSIRCSSGTYVRSLGRDLAESLGTAAVMTRLVRTSVGGFSLAEATDIDALTAADWGSFLLPASRAVEMLPQIVLSEAELAAVRLGQQISRDLPGLADKEFAAFGPTGQLAAILERRGEERLGPVCNLTSD